MSVYSIDTITLAPASAFRAATVGPASALASGSSQPAAAIVGPVGSPGPDIFVGSVGADTFDGLAGNDSISGGPGDDYLIGGAGEDTLSGDRGLDTLVGGDGNDLFMFGVGDAGTLEGRLDVLSDFQKGDRLMFAGGALTPTIVNVSGSGDFQSAQWMANLRIASGEANFVFVYSPFVSYLFVDSANDDGQAEDVVVFYSSSPLVREALVAGAALPEEPQLPGPSLSGSNSIAGTAQAEVLRGTGGDDLISGFGGADTVWGGLGADYIYALQPGAIPTAAAATYLRGEEGDDYIIGGAGFDNVNGNMGNDTISGGDGEDWAVGGKDNDLLFGDAGADLVYGNVGADTCSGGEGNDIVRGGQDNDLCFGGGGDDFVSGDKGSDTVTGGAGADIFHTFGDAGLDQVTDFNAAQGDRVQLDPGTQFTVSQVGANTVIDMVGGGQMVLVAVTLSTLPAGWIFAA